MVLDRSPYYCTLFFFYIYAEFLVISYEDEKITTIYFLDAIFYAFLVKKNKTYFIIYIIYIKLSSYLNIV